MKNSCVKQQNTCQKKRINEFKKIEGNQHCTTDRNATSDYSKYKLEFLLCSFKTENIKAIVTSNSNDLRQIAGMHACMDSYTQWDKEAEYY